MMHSSQRLAENNGRVCFESGLPMEQSNPYRRRSKSFTAFERGYRLAAADARKPANPESGS